MRFLADECCSKAIVDALRDDGHDVRYAAETDRRARDQEILALANAEERIIVTEDFDFGDLLIRDRHEAPGVVILYLPHQAPTERAGRLSAVLSGAGFDPHGALSIVERRRVRQRKLVMD